MLGASLAMPLIMGMPIPIVDTTALWSLVGHLVYGLTLGLVAVSVLTKRS